MDVLEAEGREGPGDGGARDGARAEVVGCAAECGRLLRRDALIGDVCPECDELEKAAGSWSAAVMSERNEGMRVTEVDRERGVVSFVDPKSFVRTDESVPVRTLEGLRWDESKWTNWVIDLSRARQAERPALEVNGTKALADPNVPQGELRIDGITGVRYLNPIDYAQLKAELDKRATAPVEDKPPLWGLVPKAVESYRDEMVDTIIAEQVTRGGVDTEGTRAQAERWCAMLAGCVCEGMRATTADSALKLANTDSMRPGGWRMGRDGRMEYAGKPLGRP